jgi:tetraacyldisaccharide 4'-kinase
MKAPAFWWTPPERPGWQARALAPLAALWRRAADRRKRRSEPYRAPVPVVVVGNLVAGGAGKTPLVAALLMRLADADVHVVSRGYRGRLRGPHRVDPARDSHREVGDEALMLAALAPVWVAKDRAPPASAPPPRPGRRWSSWMTASRTRGSRRTRPSSWWTRARASATAG